MSQFVGQNVGNKVLCNNGTYDITNGIVAPCSSAGGVKKQSFDSSKIDWSKLGGDDLGWWKGPVVQKKYYKFKDDFINGVLPNGNPNVIFKKGDIIQNDGVITEKFVFNTMTKGIMSKPTVVGARVEEAGGLVFVPISRLDLVDSQENAKKQYEDALKNEQEKAQSQAQSQGNNTKEPIYYILVTAGVLVAGYFAYKKFKK